MPALPFFLFGLLALGSGAIQLYMARHQPGLYKIPAPQWLITFSFILLIFAVWLSRISFTCEVTAEHLELCWTGILFNRRRLFAAGTVRDVRFEVVTKTGGRGARIPTHVLRIEMTDGQVHDYLDGFPEEGLQWIARTLVSSGVCSAARAE